MENKLKRMLQAQEPAIGCWLNFPSPDLAEFLGLAGFDFIVMDTEHYLFGAEAIHNIVRAAKLTDCTPILRVRANDPALILGYLEAGVEGIIVPHVSTAEEVKAVVDAVNYPPLGSRSANSITPATQYGLHQSTLASFQQANQETLVITMVEDLAAIENLADILAVEGLDTVFIGPEDLSASLGYMTQPGHPEVQSVIQKAESQILKSGKPLGRLGVAAQAASKAFDDGALFFALFFPAYLGQSLQSFFTESGRK